MTWPFENDTSAIIKKLATAQLKKERLKKIFTVTAISLATFLMASVLLLFPALEMFSFFLLMLAVQMIFSYLSIRQIKKQPLVEQIRELS